MKKTIYATLKQRFECLYKRNVPSQNIEELRKFVDASLGQDGGLSHGSFKHGAMGKFHSESRSAMR
jgi:hypothetical protein